MNNIPEILQLIKQDKKKSFPITPRKLFNYLGFERRTWGNCQAVDEFLNQNNLEVEPGYNDVWIDSVISIRHKAVAGTKQQSDPILRVRLLESANNIPTYIDNSATLDKAISIMLLNDYSQLPVTNNGLRGLCGYISWKTIGNALIHGVNTNIVKDYVNPNIQILSPESTLLESICVVYRHDFAVIVSKNNELSGVVTTADISSEFIRMTEPFVLIGEIENLLRVILNGKVLLEKIKEKCKLDHNVNSLDELSFANYLELLSDDDIWPQLSISGDKKTVCERLEDVRMIRNEVMHSRPDGVCDDDIEKLRLFVQFLASEVNQQH